MGNLVLNGSTSGAITISPPAIAGTNTLTIPAATGTVLVPTSSGSTGQILTTNGTTPSWVNGWTLINTVTGTSTAALQDTTSLTSTYTNYMIIIRNFSVATNNVTVQMQLYSGGSYQATSYSSTSSVSGSGASSTSTTFIGLGKASVVSNTSTYPCHGTLWISNPSSTTTYKPVQGIFSYYDTNVLTQYGLSINAGLWTGGTGAITGFQILASSGNITGTVQIYGSN